MADPAGAVQEALIAKYRGNASLQALMVGAVAPEWNIFDQGGDGATLPSFPYVSVHPITSQLGSILSFGTDAMDIYIQVSVFTKEQGFEKARAIMAQIYQLTHGPISERLVLSDDFNNALAIFDNRQELEEVQDGFIQHIADRYKLWVQG
jgi:hypothetical protein